MNFQIFQPQFFVKSQPFDFFQKFNGYAFVPSLSQQNLIYQALLLKVRKCEVMRIHEFRNQNQMLKQNNFDTYLNLQKHEISNQPEIFKNASQSVDIQDKRKTDLPNVSSIVEQPCLNRFMRLELDKIITFLLMNMGRKNQIQIDTMRKLYLHNNYLLLIYDKLVMKYFSAKKFREDIVRYILRKVFKAIKASIMKEEKVSSKKATSIFCKKYFQKSFEKIQQSGVNVANEDEIVDLFMPYKKKSKNRTMNTNFVLEIFASEDFCKQYQLFLAEFEHLLIFDNSKKKEKLIDFLMECIKKDCLSKIGSFNRLPWLDIWIEDTKSVAFSLMPDKNMTFVCKKYKDE